MGRKGRTEFALVVWLIAAGIPAAAQPPSERQALGNQIEQRFDVLPVQGGVVLKPKRASGGVRAIELTGGAIAIDGDVVSGAELRRRLGADADLVIRLSYLDAPEQRALFDRSPASAPNPVGAPPAGAAPPANAAPPAATLAPAPPVPPAPPSEPTRRRSQDRVRIGGGVEVGTDETIDGDVVAIGGSANVDGHVRGDVVAIGGSLDLGPHADVQGDVTVVGGALHRDPAARIGGEVHEVGLGDINFSPNRFRRLGPFMGTGGLFLGSALGSFFALLFTLARVAVLCVLASIVLLFARVYVDRVSERAASEPVKAGVVGLLIQLLFFPVLIATIVVLVVTIIGIPLLVLVPFALLALALVFLVGFTAIVSDVGRLAIAQLGWQEQNPYRIAALGVLITLSPVLLSRLLGFAGGFLGPLTSVLLLLGLLLEYLVWTVGLGAMALVRFDRRQVTA